MQRSIDIPADYMAGLPKMVRMRLALPDDNHMKARLTVHLPTGRVACVCGADVHVMRVDADGTNVKRVVWEEKQ